jgi:hypothetical protein
VDVLRVLIQHTPLLPNTGYLACLGLVKSSSVHVADLLDEFFALGADVNAPLHPLRRKKARLVENFYIDSALGVARFAVGYRVNPLAWIEWLLARGAKFSDFEMEQIEKNPDLMLKTEKYRKVIFEGNYRPLSKPINNWQGPKHYPSLGGEMTLGTVVLLDTNNWAQKNLPNRISFLPERRCQMMLITENNIVKKYYGTWNSNENDNVVTFCADSIEKTPIEAIYFKYRVFSAFNGAALLVTEEHLNVRKNLDSLSWLYGLLADNAWMTY